MDRDTKRLGETKAFADGVTAGSGWATLPTQAH